MSTSIPGEPWSTGVARFFDMLMKPLQRRDRKTLGRHLLRLAHHLPLVCAVTMQPDQQRRWSSSANVQVVVKIDPGRERTVDVWINCGHWALILWILRKVSIAGA